MSMGGGGKECSRFRQLGSSGIKDCESQGSHSVVGFSMLWDLCHVPLRENKKSPW